MGALADGVNRVYDAAGNQIATVIVGRGGDTLEFSSESGTLNGSVGLTEKGAGLLSTIKQDPSAIGSIARRVSGSFDPVSATGGIPDAQGAQISTLGSPSLLAGPGFQNATFNFRISNGHIEFGDGYAGRAAFVALDYVFGGPVDTSGSGRIESFDFLPGRSQVNAGVAGASAAVAAVSASLRLPAKGKKALPALDRTGKVHGELPRAEDLGQYSRDELEQLQQELRQSVQERIRKTSELGRDRAHGQRQAAEQQLIIQIEKILGGS